MPFKFNPFTHKLDIVEASSGPATVTSVSGRSGATASNVATAVTVFAPLYADMAAGGTFAKNSGSFCTTAGTYTLPASAGLQDGDLVAISCLVAAPSAIVIQAVGAQKIFNGNVSSTAAGTATSSDIGDTLFLRFRASDGFWYNTSSIGNWILN